MPELSITVEKALVVPFAASPLLAFRLRVVNADPAETIHTVVLRCQIQIEAARRRYTPQDQERLRDLFGTPERWGQTLRGMLWTHASAAIPPFCGETTVDLEANCTFDFNVAATKYFHGLEDGDVPLNFMFSGTVFYADEGGAMRVAPISWNLETRFRLPVKIWQEMMDTYYPNAAWLCLRRDVFERLLAHKVRHGIPTWEAAIEDMLGQPEGTARR
jgi:hypothetical protein